MSDHVRLGIGSDQPTPFFGNMKERAERKAMRAYAKRLICAKYIFDPRAVFINRHGRAYIDEFTAAQAVVDQLYPKTNVPRV